MKSPRRIIAYSGGVDSHVLLHKSVREKKADLLAVHIHHGLHPDADQWLEHCRLICEDLDVPYLPIHVKMDLTGKSLEAAARKARYDALQSIMNAEDELMTAHHQDDQAETVLLQLFRGAGIKGLSVMPSISRFGKGYLVRPLLTWSRKEILAYAKRARLEWIEDPTNDDQRLDRNFLRQTIFPLLRQHWPAITDVLCRTARHCAEADRLLLKQGQEDYRQELSSLSPLNIPDFFESGIVARLRLQHLLSLSADRQRNALRAWFQDVQVLMPSESQLEHILSNVLASRSDAQPLLIWDHYQLRRFQGELYLCKDQPIDLSQVPLKELLKMVPATLWENRIEQLNIRFRQGGERFHPAGRTHSQTLKKLFQEWKIPPWLRDHIPLLYWNGHLMAVPGYAYAADFPQN